MKLSNHYAIELTGGQLGKLDEHFRLSGWKQKPYGSMGMRGANCYQVWGTAKVMARVFSALLELGINPYERKL